MFSTIGTARNINNAISTTVTASIGGVQSSSTVATRHVLTPPPRSRFLAFGDPNRRPSLAERLQKKKLEETQGSEETRSVESVPKSRRFWDVVLCENEHNPMAGKKPMRGSIPTRDTQEALDVRGVINLKKVTSIPPELPTISSQVSLMQSTSEGEQSLVTAFSVDARAPRSTNLPDSGKSGDSTSSLSHLSSGISSLSGGSDTGADSAIFTRPLPRRVSPGPYEARIDPAEIRRIEEELATYAKKHRLQIALLTKVVEACEASASVQTDTTPLSSTPDEEFDSFVNAVEDESDGSLDPPDPLHEQSVHANEYTSDEGSCIRPPPSAGLSSSTPFIFHPTFDIDAVDGSALWPHLYPSLFSPSHLGMPYNHSNFRPPMAYRPFL